MYQYNYDKKILTDKYGREMKDQVFKKSDDPDMNNKFPMNNRKETIICIIIVIIFLIALCL